MSLRNRMLSLQTWELSMLLLFTRNFQSRTQKIIDPFP
jgi:hypothetical protein